jgi:hypothetical protein
MGRVAFMALDNNGLRSRRALLTAGLAAVAGTVAAAMGRPTPVGAADGEAVIVGGEYTGGSMTAITTTDSEALRGVSNTNIGVHGHNNYYSYGVQGSSYASIGVFGFSSFRYGVLGTSDSVDEPASVGQSWAGNTGLLGFSGSRDDVLPTSVAKTGVYGVADQDSGAVGVRGASTVGRAVYGVSRSGTGVFGQSDTGIAVDGESHALDAPAILARAIGDSTGVLAYSGSIDAVPAARPKTGLYGFANQDATAVGVRGTSLLGRGGRFRGAKAQIKLDPSTAASHPFSGAAGDIFLDASKRLWLCKGGSTWALIA